MSEPLTPEQEANVRKWPVPDHGGAPACWCEACLRQQLLATIDALRADAHSLSHIGAEDAAELDRLRPEARRWRAVRDMWFGANLAHPEADGCVLVEIQLPKGCKVSAYPEATIDEAADRLAEEGTDA